MGRLSSAGIEPLTVAVGQAMCSRIPLGAHGEKVLSDAMAGLKACSSFGDVIWFGVGVRHILRVLVQTSEGASLVALCATLSEGYSTSVSALILYEMAKRSGSPRELTPSFAQWEALVKVCASGFCHTTLGIRMNQVSRLAGLNPEIRPLPTLHPEPWAAGHPDDLAQITTAIGHVAAGRLLEIFIVGGRACSWLAVFAEIVLGLRVAVTTVDEHIVSANFDNTVAKAQVNIRFSDACSQGGIVCVGKVFTLRDGTDFISQYFNYSDPGAPPTSSFFQSRSFLGGRTSMNVMFEETFGEDAAHLFGRKPLLKRTIDVTDTAVDLFVRIYSAGAAFYVYLTTECGRYANVHEFIVLATAQIPELRHLKTDLLKTANKYIPDSLDGETICGDYIDATSILAKGYCRCRVHNEARDPNPYRFCLVTVVETILVVSYLLGRISMAVALNPRRTGLLNLYDNINHAHTPSGLSAQPSFYDKLVQIETSLVSNNDAQILGHIFLLCLELFSGDSVSFTPSNTDTIPALSDGRLFFFVDSIRNLSDRYDQASIIHVGPGYIQAGNRLHSIVRDHSNTCHPMAFDHPHTRQDGYQAQHVDPTRADISDELEQDTTTPELKMKAVVGDTIELAFWYDLSSRYGHILISPASFINHHLASALWYKRRISDSSIHPDSINATESKCFSTEDHLKCDTHYFANGEGCIPPFPGTAGWVVCVRPHCGNVIGRCAAIVTSQDNPHQVAILDQRKDIDIFIRCFNNHRLASQLAHNVWILV